MITIAIEAKEMDGNVTLIEIADVIESVLEEIGLKSVSISANSKRTYISRRHNESIGK